MSLRSQLPTPPLSLSRATTCHSKQRVDVEVRLELQRPNSRPDADTDTCLDADSLYKSHQVRDHIPNTDRPVDSDLTFNSNHSTINELRSAVTAFIRTFPLLTDAVHDAPPSVATIRLPVCTKLAYCQTLQSERHLDKSPPTENHPFTSHFDNSTHPKLKSPLVHVNSCHTHPDSHSRSFGETSNCPTHSHQQICTSVQAYLCATKIRICTQDDLTDIPENALLQEPHGSSVLHSRKTRSVLFMRADIYIHLYHARSSGEVPEIPELLESLAIPHALPYRLDDNLWYALAFGPAHKRTLIRYITVRRLLHTRRVDRCVIPSSGFVLLYGPPGTGKTTLCRAVATHFAIRHGLSGVFLHIRMDKLVSKWLGESAKLVASVFEATAQCANTYQIVFLLLDEVESVGSARSHTQGITRSSGDEVRIVNALLAALDGIAQYSNVVVMATSNLLDDIDDAVVDRADMRLHIDIPHVSIIRHLILECVKQLVDTGMIMTAGNRDVDLLTATGANEVPAWLQEACTQMEGISARQLRKLSIVALTLGTGVDDERGMKLTDFVRHLVHAKQMCAIQGDVKNFQ